jgi:glutathione S-transferase
LGLVEILAFRIAVLLIVHIAAMAPQITFYFLQASRCIRTAWQLHELGLDYDLKFSDRVGGLAPPEFRKEAGGLGKFPTIVDNGVTIAESGNIAE